MTRRGSLLLELVIALGILTGSAITISGVFVRSARMVERGRLRVEASDLASSAITLIQIGQISPEAADQLSDVELHTLVEPTDGNSTPTEPRFVVAVNTEPTDWRSLTRVTVTVEVIGSEQQIAQSYGMVNLARIRNTRGTALGDLDGGGP